MESKLIGLSIFFCIVQSSFALKCYECNSIQFPNCKDLSDKPPPVDCTVDNYVKQGGILSDRLGFGSRVTIENKDKLVPICLKATSNNTRTGVYVERLCTFELQNEDTCALARTKLQMPDNGPIDFCGTCKNKDLCNNGNQINLFYSLIAFGAIVSSARLFA